MPETRPNVIIIHSDQLRADCVGCYGNDVVKTPHIDRLAAQGTRFARAFAQHPQCVPSRSSMLTGRYPHTCGALSNHTAITENETTLGEYFMAADYRSIGVGKLHLFPQKEKQAFTETMLSGGQHSGATSPDCLAADYRDWLKDNGYWEIAREAYAIHGSDEYWANFQANTNPIPAEAFIDSWVGDRAVEYIENQPADEPFFMFVGLPNPHTPFDCPEPYASMYDPADMPVPPSFGADLSNKPPMQAAFRREGRRVNYEDLDETHLRKCMAYYYGAVSLVDDQVGKIMTALEEQGLAENTVVAFCSDHGELLGAHGMLTKSIDLYPMLYDVGLHVPLVIRAPQGKPGVVCDALVELMDLCPTLLQAADLEIAPQIQAQSLCETLTGGAAPHREYVFAESGAVKMLRSEKYKLVHYPNQPYGELYDLKADPHEMNNLYGATEYAELQAALTRDLLDRLIYTEAPLHGESPKSPAYWRELYRQPFAMKE